MEYRYQTILHLFLITLALGAACLIVRAPKDSQWARVSMLDVGQGDSFLIQAANGRQILIDGGKDEKVLTGLAEVMPSGDRSIDVVIATHPDADHIGGLSLVLERYNVGLFLTSNVSTDTETFRSLFRTLKERDIPAYYAVKGMHVSLDGSTSLTTSVSLPITFTILFPDRNTAGWETNAASVVGRLQIGRGPNSRSMLFTGDSPSSVEHHLATTDPKEVDVDILKLGHHGSKTSTSDEYLRATSPALALISVGVSNRYGHPAPEVIARLKRLNIPFISTQDTGTFTLSTDGVKWYKN